MKADKDKRGYCLDPETHRRLVWLKCFLVKPPKDKLSEGCAKCYKFGELIDRAVLKLYQETVAELHAPSLPPIPGNVIEVSEGNESAEEIVSEIHSEAVPV